MKRNLSGVMMVIALLGLFIVVYNRMQSFSDRDGKPHTAKPVKVQLNQTTAYPAVSHEPHILFLPE
ncbi:MAG: hypothetical protein C5B52_04895 [Bacteroidetes bacterium]|nr:MAG: hypothetical protein C5B52_04895 [Bacteroidota bacterium]